MRFIQVKLEKKAVAKSGDIESAQEGLNNAMRTAKEQYNKAQESVKNFFGSLF